MYVCGVTVYDRAHVGHARAMVTFDILYRYLRLRGLAVTFVRNLTDVDDKIIRRAAELGTEPQALAESEIEHLRWDAASLGCLPPTHEPRATEHIPDMLSLIEALLAKGLAYAAEGDVYFAVGRFPGYGRLSHRRLDEMAAGARVEVDPRKRHPMDFALWKASRPGEPAWPSPWGPGRPGWHIECSAMAERYLGLPFDLHGGGSDLIFPHHENEIAQSEGGRGRPFARHWMHNGMITFAEEKMSKSLGNVLTIAEAGRMAVPEALRLLFLGTHYSTPIEFSRARLEESERALVRLYEGLARAAAAAGGDEPLPASPPVPFDAPPPSPWAGEFLAALDDDLNTARAMGLVFERVRELNRELDAGRREAAVAIRRDLAVVPAATGLLSARPAEVLGGIRQRRAARTGLSEEEIAAAVAEREQARRARDFARADAIRARLREQGIVLEDTAEGTIWRPA